MQLSPAQQRGYFLFLLLLAGIALGPRLVPRQEDYGSLFRQWPVPQLEPDLGRVDNIRINQADAEAWATLPGIGEVLSQRIVKFRQAKGGFRHVDEIRQVYGLSPQTYQKIVPYLILDSLPPALKKSRGPYHKKVRPAPQPIDINRADTTQFQALPGIGSVLSNRIIKYRTHLGGFTHIGDLRKVYGLSPETFEKIQPWLTLDTTGIRSSVPPAQASEISPPIVLLPDTLEGDLPLEGLDLNMADSASLEKLPGIGPVLAQRIIRYREIIGYYSQKRHLLQVYGMSAKNYRMAAPYLKVTPPRGAKKHDLNMASQKLIAKYPGISDQQAADLIQLRKKQGFFPDWEALQAAYPLPDSVWQTLQDYFFL